MSEISWEQFTQVELRAGTITAVEPFPQARRPAYRITVDLGPELGIRRTSAQVTELYTPEDLIGRQVLCVVNLPVKQIGPMRSEFLLTGFYAPDGVVLAVPERPVRNGDRLG